MLNSDSLAKHILSLNIYANKKNKIQFELNKNLFISIAVNLWQYIYLLSVDITFLVQSSNNLYHNV